jgi:hypothetical protein
MIALAFLVAMFGFMLNITRRPLSAWFIFVTAVSLAVAGRFAAGLPSGAVVIDSFSRDVMVIGAIYVLSWLWFLNDQRLMGKNLFRA